ncbi:Aste57867_3943 [Aphanomyces stellatus]|uniref:Aste57867_3943 protein n=1 Tax=Aphanomyces stellatus TaxID=120398 RepID=A0A485KBP8_9STRA|nr:hypothetical protein As57867_003932 [Aphanomyces stellatus]VFT81080.1 Aste57867_3943 [Aphanomyces stellatus]
MKVPPCAIAVITGIGVVAWTICHFLSKPTAIRRRRRSSIVLRLFPKRTFNSLPWFSKMHHPYCDLCATPFEDDEMVQRLPCDDTFHASCLDGALDDACPTCSRDLVEMFHVLLAFQDTDEATNTQRC